VRIVLGLGNPGEKYRRTRHNLGHEVVDELRRRWGASGGAWSSLERSARILAVEIRGRSVVLAKSMTYMNRSGRAGVALCDHYGTEPTDLLVVYDDADLELGRVRIRPRGGAGGHNGMRSLITGLASEEMPRVRLGILGHDRRRSELADYVLEEFEPGEVVVAREAVETAADAAETVVVEGLAEAMNRFNVRRAREGGSAADE
jgi:PTH1 family peptidyl-tRNA hydrolase